MSPLDELKAILPAQADLDRRELAAINAARAEGATWLQIGRALGYEGRDESVSCGGRARALRLARTVAAGGVRRGWNHPDSQVSLDATIRRALADS